MWESDSVTPDDSRCPFIKTGLSKKLITVDVLWLDSYVGQNPLLGCRKAKVLEKMAKMIASAEV